MSPHNISERTNMKTAVIGAGTMGHGIAQAFAQGGWDVWLVDLRADILQHALFQLRANLCLFQEQGILTAGESEVILSRINVTVNPEEAVRDAEFVTEAVSEDMIIKKGVFKMLDEQTPKDAVLASNTSGLNVSEIAAATRTSRRVIGTNWWNPPHIIPLVEIMRGENTTEETLERTRKVLKSIGKKPITILKPIQGFVGNRLQMALFREALSLLEKGIASVEDIDTAVSFGPGFRYPVLGPFRVSDFGGLDVFHHLCEELFNDLDRSIGAPSRMKRLVENDRIGIKSGSGFYDYSGSQESELIKDRDRRLLQIHKAVFDGEK